MRTFLAEIKKCKRRRLWLLYLCAFLVTVLWIGSSMIRYPFTPEEASVGYYMLILNYSLMNLIFLPVILAACASRVCDIETKGETDKMLLTMQSKMSLFHGKILLNAIYILIFAAAQITSLFLMGMIFHATQPVPVFQLIWFFISTFVVSLVLYVMQQILSLLMRNQLMPLFIGLMGTFTGVFSAFFPYTILTSIVPWGYYAVFNPVMMQMGETAQEVSYFTVPLPLGRICVFLVFGFLFYLIGLKCYLKKEV
ncbi:MAG: ABC transporter permease [Ruminococcus sp.]|jgi:hypothetical protein